MQIIIDLKKSIEENASVYFEKAKKYKKKLEGALKAYEKTKEELNKTSEKPKQEEKPQRKKEWYEKFRWFYTSSKKLVILGRDATTNEIIIKKHTLPDEIVFHSSLGKSPFAVIKADSVNDKDIQETADATLTFSAAWKNNIISLDVYYIKAEQVSKKAKSGEYLTKGSFMIYGKKTFVKATLNLAIGIFEGKVMAGPLEAVKSNCNPYVELIPGRKKPSEIAKYISKVLNCEIDDVIRVLPAGLFEVKKSR